MRISFANLVQRYPEFRQKLSEALVKREFKEMRDVLDSITNEISAEKIPEDDQQFLAALRHVLARSSTTERKQLIISFKIFIN